MESLVPFLALALFFWLLVVRPQRRRMAAAQELQRSLAVGQQVMTASGLYGTIVALTDEDVILEVAPGTTTRWVRGAISAITPEHKE